MTTRLVPLLLVMALFSAVAGASPASCDSQVPALELEPGHGAMDLSTRMAYVAGDDNARPAALARSSAWCSPITSPWRIADVEAESHWFAVTLENTSDERLERIVSFDGPFSERIAVHRVGADEARDVAPLPRDRLGFPVDMEPFETTTLISRIDADGITLQATLFDVTRYVGVIAMRNLAASVLIGAIVCLLVFQVFASVVAREYRPLTPLLGFALAFEWARLDYDVMLFGGSEGVLAGLEFQFGVLTLMSAFAVAASHLELRSPRWALSLSLSLSKVLGGITAIVLGFSFVSESAVTYSLALLTVMALMLALYFIVTGDDERRAGLARLALSALPFGTGAMMSLLAGAGLVTYHPVLPYGFDIGLVVSILSLVVLEHRQRESVRLEQESELRQTQRRYQLALEGSADGIFEWDVQEAEVLASSRAHEILGLEYVPGWRPQSVIAALLSDDELERISTMQKAMFVTDDLVRVETFVTSKGGEKTWLLVQGKLDYDEDGKVLRLVGAVSDITEQKRLERRLRHDALHDFLTGLPNRTLLQDRMKRAVERLKRNADARACLLFIDLDNFKAINDSLGHGFGDEVLEALGNRLLEFVRTTDTVSRIGGDEFVILLEEMNSRKEAERFAERILGKIRMPMEIRGQQLVPSVSIGLTMVEDPNESVEMLLGDADIAMYAAKERGKGRVVAFETTMRTRAAKRLETEAALRRAIEQDELYLVYQPIFGIGRGGAKAVGVEALLRWNNGDRQDIAPSDLLSLAEENGMIEDIGRWVIHTVAQQLSHWRQQGFPEDFYANINLSSVHFESDEILSEILGALDPLGVPRNALRVEVVETAVIQHPEKALSVIKLLQSQGILVSIDDFGTGYSSLSYLHRFPFHALKVDRSFVSEIAESRATRDIITAIIMMARRLGIRVVAEGIESQAQLNFLRSIGCDMAQGFLLAMPEDPTAMARHFDVRAAAAAAAPEDDAAVPETVTVGNVPA